MDVSYGQWQILGEDMGVTKVVSIPFIGNEEDKTTKYQAGLVISRNNNDFALYRQSPGRMRQVSYWS
ncbi:hypothetical protein DPMN_163531 [Dreissena polymorpha]|uniref:Uncharacterized protein n=1 Tax=Dreissena polymorpha TaxID=45954 RepID=A0A9D4EVY4_DREPO|nr:hypothetical protein DPMN_163531 [Dreissena polymorpha]